jgi:hypothetical protein
VTVLRVIEPEEECDRCGHASKYHGRPAEGSACKIVEGPASPGQKAYRCFCDSFFPIIQTRGSA